MTKNKFQNNAFYIFIKSTKFFLSFYKNSRYPSNLLFFIQNRCLHFTDNILHYHLLCHFQIPLCILPCEWLNVLHPFALIFLKFPLNILSSFHFCIPNPSFFPDLFLFPIKLNVCIPEKDWVWPPLLLSLGRFDVLSWLWLRDVFKFIKFCFDICWD